GGPLRPGERRAARGLRLRLLPLLQALRAAGGLPARPRVERGLVVLLPGDVPAQDAGAGARAARHRRGDAPPPSAALARTPGALASGRDLRGGGGRSCPEHRPPPPAPDLPLPVRGRRPRRRFGIP